MQTTRASRLTASRLEATGNSSQEAHWIPLSDLMTGLMVLFWLIAVTYMMRVEANAAKIREVAVDDLPKWRADLV